MIYAAYKIEWTEYERGWGCRPDGTSFHETKEIADKYRKNFIDRQPKGPAPDEYTTPGDPELVEVDKELYEILQKEKTIWKSELQRRKAEGTSEREFEETTVAVMRKKVDIEEGDMVFHMRGYMGIVAKKDYNGEKEVMVDWLGYYDWHTDTWTNNVPVAARTSIDKIQKIRRHKKR